MNDEVFFDTNILVYATDDTDPRGIIALELLEDGGLISVQVLNEFAAVASRKLRWGFDEIEIALTQFRTLCRPALPVCLKTHEAALRIAAQHGLHMYDSLIIASALRAGCTTLMSEDMQNARRFDGRLTIHNPFVT